ncbi:hypothetical protein [Paenibacillus piri]|uniref:Uncharacterized protein n=1 Tax=Paenibacillus piri TaxID=2547395 RepID=A0A4R5K7F3_9BACL|nr:hypothetical protein [Paenibacillus piri]TDF90106.1 hypothetical protein E1757_34235 [Paenibacillus piri]
MELSDFTYGFYAIKIDTERTFMFKTKQFQSVDDVVSELKGASCFIELREKMKSQLTGDDSGITGEQVAAAAAPRFR